MVSIRPEGVGFATDAPVRAVATRDLAATPEVVFDTLADAASWPRWFPGMRRCEWLTEPPHQIGSRRRVVVGALRLDERFVVWDRPHRWGFTFEAANLPLAYAGVELIDLEPLDAETTRVRYTMAIEPPRLAAPLARRGTPAIHRTLDGALAGLERHLAGSTTA